jgi:hypothetical protein
MMLWSMNKDLCILIKDRSFMTTLMLSAIWWMLLEITLATTKRDTIKLFSSKNWWWNLVKVCSFLEALSMTFISEDHKTGNLNNDKLIE